MVSVINIENLKIESASDSAWTFDNEDLQS